ncbi:MAG: hypothetical protein RLZZ196_2118 [Bacteroidota bacterium]|jgi:hypothetical protein
MLHEAILLIKQEWLEVQITFKDGYINFKDEDKVVSINQLQWETVKTFIDKEIEKNG